MVEYAKDHAIRFLVRGIRTNLNRALAPDIATFFIPADPELAEVSSSRLKELARKGGDGSRFCPPEVWAMLLGKIRAEVRDEL